MQVQFFFKIFVYGLASIISLYVNCIYIYSIFDRYEKVIMKYDNGISNTNILLLTFVIMDGKNQFKKKRGNLSDRLKRNNKECLLLFPI